MTNRLLLKGKDVANGIYESIIPRIQILQEKKYNT